MTDHLGRAKTYVTNVDEAVLEKKVTLSPSQLIGMAIAHALTAVAEELRRSVTYKR